MVCKGLQMEGIALYHRGHPAKLFVPKTKASIILSVLQILPLQGEADAILRSGYLPDRHVLAGEHSALYGDRGALKRIVDGIILCAHGHVAVVGICHQRKVSALFELLQRSDLVVDVLHFLDGVGEDLHRALVLAQHSDGFQSNFCTNFAFNLGLACVAVQELCLTCRPRWVVPIQGIVDGCPGCRGAQGDFRAGSHGPRLGVGLGGGDGGVPALAGLRTVYHFIKRKLRWIAIGLSCNCSCFIGAEFVSCAFVAGQHNSVLTLAGKCKCTISVVKFPGPLICFIFICCSFNAVVIAT